MEVAEQAVIAVGIPALGQPQSQLGTAVATPRVWQRDSSSLQLQGVKGPQGFTLTTSLHISYFRSFLACKTLSLFHTITMNC